MTVNFDVLMTKRMTDLPLQLMTRPLLTMSQRMPMMICSDEGVSLLALGIWKNKEEDPPFDPDVETLPDANQKNCPQEDAMAW